MMRQGTLVAVVLWSTSLGCVGSASNLCPDQSSICPAERSCALVQGTTYCVLDDQIAACLGLEEGSTCLGDGRCYDGVCLPRGCGNGLRDLDEACDDGDQVGGNGCSADCQSDETCGNGVVDVIAGERCDDAGVGAGLSHDGCASDCTEEFPRWVTVPTYRGTTGAEGIAVVYDAWRDRVVAYADGHVWERGEQTWRFRAPTVQPSVRTGTAMAFDAVRRVVVMFAGDGLDDTWEWDGASWTLRVPTSGSPSPRSEHAMVYDPIGKRVVLFGGVSSTGTTAAALGDTWAWDGTAWTQLGAGPPARERAAMAYDPVRGVIVLFGGLDAVAQDLADTWELAGDVWTQRASSGAVPPGRHDHGAGFDPTSRRVVIQGGKIDLSTVMDTWAWDGSAWVMLADDRREPRPSLVTSTRTGELLLVSSAGRTYRWTGTAWMAVDEAFVQAPFQRSFAAAAADPTGRRLVVHGGSTGSFITAATLVWDGRWLDRSDPLGPGALVESAMAYDARRGVFVLFGGLLVGQGAMGATWTFDGAQWTKRDPPPLAVWPAPRYGHAMAYDARRDRVVLFGGRDGSGNMLGDTWVWDGAAWSQIVSPSEPPPRGSAAIAYDPIAAEVVLFGGDRTFAGFALRDTWVWNGAEWRERVVPGPPARFASGMAWDAARRTMVLFGGTTANVGEFADAWEWTGTAWRLLSSLGAESPRSDHAVVPAPGGAGVWVVGGSRTNAPVAEISWLAWRSLAGDEVCSIADLDHDGLIGCAASGATEDPDCWHMCQPSCLPGAEPVTCAGAAGCGDGTCTAPIETCVSCPADCGPCPDLCGDLVCTGAETATTCAGDCP